MRSFSFVGGFKKGRSILIGTLADRPLNIILGHRGPLGIGNGQPQTRIPIGIGSAFLNGNGNIFNDFGENF